MDSVFYGLVFIAEGDVNLSRFSQNNLNFVSQLFNTSGTVKFWHLSKQEYRLNSSSYFQWLQLINSIPGKWRFSIKQSGSNAKNRVIHDHDFIKGSRVLILEKLKSCQIVISSRTYKITKLHHLCILKQCLM